MNVLNSLLLSAFSLFAHLISSASYNMLFNGIVIMRSNVSLKHTNSRLQPNVCFCKIVMEEYMFSAIPMDG